jgi:GTP cyclohydrolase I
MKQKETLLNIQLNGEKIELSDMMIDDMGDNHISTTVDTPMRDDAFDKTDDEKLAIIQDHFKAIMETLGLDLNDDSLKGTPKRVAKMD